MLAVAGRRLAACGRRGRAHAAEEVLADEAAGRPGIIDRNFKRNHPWHPSTKSSSSATSAATPKCATFPSGDQVANVTIATTDRWKDKTSGEMKEATEWHRVVFNGRLAEIAGEYLRKGSQVYVEGSLRTRKWTDKDGVEKYTTEIRADQMQMLGSRQGMGARGGGGGGGGYGDDGYGDSGYDAAPRGAPRPPRRAGPAPAPRRPAARAHRTAAPARGFGL